MRLLALLLLAIGVAGACPVLAEVTILRGSSAPPPPVAPAAEPAPVVAREIVYTPVYPYVTPVYIAIRPHHAVQPAPVPVTPGVASGWPLFGGSSPRR